MQTGYQRVCGCTTGHWGSGNPTLTISLRCCRATTYPSSVVPCFTTMLLSPRPFGSRLGVHLEVICPELRPPLVAIPSVRDTAHTFTASGAAPEVILHTKMEPLFPFQQPSQTFIRCLIPFHNFTSPYSEGTACAFAGYFVRCLPFYPYFLKLDVHFINPMPVSLGRNTM